MERKSVPRPDHRGELRRLPEVSSVIEMADRRYEPNEIEPKWQELWAREHTWEVANDVDAAGEVLCAGDAPVSERRAAHRAPEELRARRRDCALPSPHRAAGAAPDGLRRVRPARREPRDQDRHPPAQSTEASIAAFQQAFRSWGISIDWSREFATCEPRYYRWTQWIFLKLLEQRPRLPQAGRGQVVPPRPDRPRQRAGH